nr:hypothetical protein I308_03101 [Cryptococcus tetragattii IND107]
MCAQYISGQLIAGWATQAEEEEENEEEMQRMRKEMQELLSS